MAVQRLPLAIGKYQEMRRCKIKIILGDFDAKTA
jgi:hypothetical protein